MSAQYAHYSLGQNVLKNTKIDEKIGTIDFDSQAFLAGCQGPDFCFYHVYHRNAGIKKWIKIAGTIHSKDTGKFFREALKYSKNSSDSVKSYLLGYLTHYSLDSSVHPYVFHYCFSSRYHMILESGMDVYLMRREGFNPHNTPIYTILGKLKNQSKKDLGAFWSKLLKDVHDIEISKKEMEIAVTDIRRVFRLSLSKFGFKKKLLSLIAKRMKLHDYLIALFYYYDDCLEKDYLNEDRETWTAPYDDSIKCDDSFFDILKRQKKWQ